MGAQTSLQMNVLTGSKSLALFALFTFYFNSVVALNCYQCISTNSSRPFECNEFMTDDYNLDPQSCDDIYGAKYCVKHVGRFEALGLNCYQCTSAEEWKCMDGDLVKNALEPKSCDHIFEAQYCIKTVGRYGGGIGTKRFCSTNDLGNYCDYVRQVGDKLTYRTCIYTCSGNGCNPASVSLPNKISIFFSILLLRFFDFSYLFRR